MSVSYYEKSEAESRLPAFRLIAYYVLFYANFKLTQFPGYTQNDGYFHKKEIPSFSIYLSDSLSD